MERTGQSASFEFQMGSTPKEVIADFGNGKCPLDFVLNGITIRANLELWDKFAKTIMAMLK
jgi:hypothetical protein